jgi:excisionase family DNA binding protein
MPAAKGSKTHPADHLQVMLERLPGVRHALQQRAVFNEQETAVYLNISLSTLRKMRDGNPSAPEGPPFIRIGRSVRYRRTDLDDWLDQFPAYRHVAEVQ